MKGAIVLAAVVAAVALGGCGTVGFAAVALGGCSIVGFESGCFVSLPEAKPAALSRAGS